METKPRYANIDLLRTIAISMVVFYHAVNMSKVPQWFWDISEVGSLGVDLFFVLSGFLVGGLYFKERRDTGTVDVPRFIGRRIFRTIPMYFLIMPVAYLATYSVKKIAFDWHYLLFLQNYVAEMPFYVISWSLCVEEHFYLVMPFVLPFLIDKNNQLRRVLWVALLCLPLFLRVFLYSNHGGNTPFGYYITASHFRFEGLLLGVAMAYYCLYKPDIFKPLVRYRALIYGLTIASVLTCAFIPIFVKICFSISWVALTFTLSLLTLYFAPSISLAQTALNRHIAFSSYSTYLVHSLVIHACVKVFGILHINSPFLTVPLMVAACFAVGFLVYSIAEKQLMYWRDKFLPAKRVNSFGFR